MKTSITDLVYPDQNALARLLEELTKFFAQFSAVNRIFSFGSMARGDWDRWSDIDMLVVTQASSEQQWQFFTKLRQHKPILHHHAFISMKPSGGFIPGTVFENESVFHMLDLNFISSAQYQSPPALERFGRLCELYRSGDDCREDDNTVWSETKPDSPEEKRIGAGIHWTKKAVKNILRGSDDTDTLVTMSTRLKEIMQDFPEDQPMPGGNICWLARRYIEIADFLLAQRFERSSPSQNRL